MKRFVFIRITNDIPVEIKFFTDLTAGMKNLAEMAAFAGPPLALWSSAKGRGFSYSPNHESLWLYEVEIF